MLRLSFRWPKRNKELIQQAADLVGLSLSEFVVNAAICKAQEFIDNEKKLKQMKENNIVFMREIKNS